MVSTRHLGQTILGRIYSTFHNSFILWLNFISRIDIELHLTVYSIIDDCLGKLKEYMDISKVNLRIGTLQYLDLRVKIERIPLNHEYGNLRNFDTSIVRKKDNQMELGI